MTMQTIRNEKWKSIMKDLEVRWDQEKSFCMNYILIKNRDSVTY